MMYGCPRSASVVSLNYCTCSTIDRIRYLELLNLYPNLSQMMRTGIIDYQDPLKTFLEISLNQVDYFRDLPGHVKCEIIFQMKFKNIDKGKFLYKKEELSSEMYVVQSGSIEVSILMDEKDPVKREFVIESLHRGSIINHNSFLMNDDMDTDAKVVTNASVYFLSIDILKNLRQKYIELD